MGCRVGDLGYFSCMWSAINISLDCPEHILSSFLSESNWAHSVCWIYWTDHLPTYILFDKTTEVARFPEITSESKVFVPKVTKVISITRYSYGLDQCFRFFSYGSVCIVLHGFGICCCGSTFSSVKNLKLLCNSQITCITVNLFLIHIMLTITGLKIICLLF
jgi:hypothetical protein